MSVDETGAIPSKRREVAGSFVLRPPAPDMLVRLEQVRQDLANADTIADILDIRDKAEALRVCARGARQALETCNVLAELRIRAERRCGELLRNLLPHRGGRRPKRLLRVIVSLPPHLADLGISPVQSHRYQLLASLDPSEVDQYIRNICELRRELTTAGLLRLARQREHEHRLQAIRDHLEKHPVPVPTGPWGVIVADPPWPFGLRVDDPTHRGRTPYPSMTLEEIRAVPVADLADPAGCVVWLWTTNAHLATAIKVLTEDWGCTYATTLTWVKESRTGRGNSLGLGSLLRNVTEHCLLGWRGRARPAWDLHGQSTALHAPVGGHSRKPEAFYQLVCDLTPGTSSRLDLFARAPRTGFVGWGAESSEPGFVGE